MKQYIDKAALVAEIERRIKGLEDCHADTVAGYDGEISGLKRVLFFIDTLEVKEVDSNNAFIEKAYEWIENNMLSSNQQDKSRLYYKQFVDYMKGE